MSVLSDTGIRQAIKDGRIIIDPPPLDEQHQPATIDLHLSKDIILHRNRIDNDTGIPDQIEANIEIIEFYMQPGDFIIASTIEKIGIDNTLLGKVEGKSTPARDAIIVEFAGVFDPGWYGDCTFELVNFHPYKPFKLVPGMYIGQIMFFELDQPCERPYGSEGLNSKYQGQVGPTKARG